MTNARPAPIRRDWLAKTLAGTLLGFTLALGCSGLFVLLNPDMATPVKAQLAMWMVAPIWLGTLGGVFLFGSGRRAWLWLGGANLLIFGVLAAARMH
ncbi:MAG: hypothetical protein J0H00_06710 [Burkholderiales bacterium]|nr:hypothetical protein [Burkholderiales bacterium]OJX06696.1 MAG: hypothetical protein BGO72_16415 [Burkholderiales bacterium 70-64]